MATNDIMSVEDQQRLELSLTVRQNIIKSLVSKNAVPEKPEDRSLLISALDGMDRTVLSRAKIKSDDSNAKSQEESAKTIAELLMRVDSKRRGSRTIDVDTTVLPSIETVTGETFVGVQPVKYDEIMGPQ
jgi:hypothetical protein